ncbi:Metal-dependent hydrolase [Planctomycetales bacterium 10988]|nr:Metal-dependent hydrolase [Planctomycetales bacterium 10988]
MRVIDLTLPLDSKMAGFQIENADRLETEGWNATYLTMYSHCGTHMDAKKHFLKDGASIDQQLLEDLIGPALVLDITPVVPKQLIGIADLQPFEKAITPGCRILLRTDWYHRYGESIYRDELPRISLELATWLVKKEVCLLGVEPPSVADIGNIEELTQVHEVLLGGGVVIVEGLANLDQLRTQKVHFIALPLKIVGGDGSPVRAVAVEGDEFLSDQL